VEPLAVAQSYFDAWNHRDPEAIAAILGEDGTYADPLVPAGLDARGTAEYAGGLFAAFPDLSFELVSKGLTGEGLVAAQWVMRGTNHGSFQGLPPTGRSIELPGADFIAVEGGRVKSVQGHFDSGVVPRQLGLQVMVMPVSAGAFSFGRAMYVTSGKGSQPGAFSLTALEARSPEEQEEISARARDTAQEMLGMPGFISWIGAVVGNRMYTITAWEEIESSKELRTSPAHREAMQRFFGPELASGGQTGVWAPHRLNGMWVRCAACDRMVKPEGAATCECGAALPEPSRWW
jgi:steroid delta-isomerase-like uncharacterized protein